MLKTGPDGALWVADMYRAVIEHPEWIPDDWQKTTRPPGRPRQGADLPRLSRSAATPRPIPRLDRLDTAGLVAALDSPNGWQRDTAQQLLLERQDKAAVPLLEKLAVECKRPLGRLHALCALEGLGASNPELLKKALADESPGVRRHAVRLSEPLMAKDAALGESVAKLAPDDADPLVRQQVAYSLGEWDDARAGKALGRMIAREGDEPFVAAAVLSSANGKNLADIVRGAARPAGGGAVPRKEVVAALGRLAAATKNVEATVVLMNTVSEPRKGGGYAPAQYEATAALAAALDGSDAYLAHRSGAEGEAVAAAIGRVGALIDAAHSTAADDKAPEADRAAAVGVIGLVGRDWERDSAFLTGLLSPHTPPAVQSAALAALGRVKRRRCRRSCCGNGRRSRPTGGPRHWTSYSPARKGRPPCSKRSRRRQSSRPTSTPRAARSC